MTKTFKEFINDFNQFYQTNYRILNLDTNSIFDAMYKLYDTDDFEIDYDEETIELF